MRHYFLDVETLGIESNSIVLSIALLPFDLETDSNTSFQDLCKRCHFWKLSVKDQHEHKRTCEQSTLEWWNRQSQASKLKSLKPSKDDMDPVKALQLISKTLSPPTDAVWTRGNLDQVCLESLYRTYGMELPVADDMYYDIRTALMIQGRDKNCSDQIDGFVLHNPVHDVARDVLTLLKTE